MNFISFYYIILHKIVVKMSREVRSLHIVSSYILVEKVSFLKTGSAVLDLMCWGSLFQAETATTTKAQSPIEEPLVSGIISRNVLQLSIVMHSFVLLQILYNFHKHKNHKGVDAMLLKLYDPLLWRSLKVSALCVTIFQLPESSLTWPQ